SKGILK
ncbi:hypothetical protein D047_4979B, partial [Vibrio parahaemolyticus VPTS-2010_2]